MCAIHIMCKTVTVCLRVADPHLFSDRICVRTIQTQTSRLLPEDLTLALKQVLSLCPISTLPTFISGGDM